MWAMLKTLYLMKTDIVLVLYKFPHLFSPLTWGPGNRTKENLFSAGQPRKQNSSSHEVQGTKGSNKNWQALKTCRINYIPRQISLGRYLQQGWSCSWNPEPDLCRDSKCWEEYLLSPWAGCLAWLVAVSWHHLQLSNVPSRCCHLHIQAWQLNQVKKAMGILLLLLSLTVGKADCVNTFLDGRAGEAYPFLLRKVSLPNFICCVLSCSSLTTSLFGSCLSAGKSVLCHVKWLLSLPAWIPIWLQQNRKEVSIYVRIFLWYLGPWDLSQGSEKSSWTRTFGNPPSCIGAELPYEEGIC